MHLEHSSSIRQIGKLLRLHYNEVADEPLPRRWVDLINYLNAKERAATRDAPGTSNERR